MKNERSREAETGTHGGNIIPPEDGSVVFERIVLATDFEASSRRASAVVRKLAANSRARVFLVHAHDPLLIPVADPTGVLAPAIDPQTLWEPAERAARDNLNSEAVRFGANIAIEPILRSGVAWEEVLAVAKEKNADLIVVGSHGRSGLSRTLLGSVAEKITRLAVVPVLVVRETHEP